MRSVIFFVVSAFSYIIYSVIHQFLSSVTLHPRPQRYVGHNVTSALSYLPSPPLGRLQCCCCLPCGTRHEDIATIIEDNCCRCNYAALSRMLDLGEIEVVYATFHVDVGETPFFVALDYTKRKVCRSRFVSIVR